MSRLKLAALGLTALLTVIAGVTTIADSREAAAADTKTASWSGQPRTVRVYPTGADQAVGPGAVELRSTFPGTISRVAVGSGRKVKNQTASSFVLTNTVGFGA